MKAEFIAEIAQIFDKYGIKLGEITTEEGRIVVKEVVEVEDWTKDLLVPKCEFQGYCDEFQSCGRKNKK